MVNQGLNLSLNELGLIAEHRNISDYENKSAKDLIKALRGSRPRLGINKFSKDADKYRKLFYDIKNYKHLSELEMEEISKTFNKLEKTLNFKKPRNNINTILYEDLNSDKELNLDDADDDKYRKIGSIRKLFEESNRNYYKSKAIDRAFAGEVNNYIKYISEGDKDEKLSLRENLNIIRPDLRDLINRQKPIERLNNNNNDRGEWKIMLRMYIKCISTKPFNETRTMHPESKQVEFYIGSDTENVINTLFNTLLQNVQRIQEILNERGSKFLPDSVELLECELRKIDTIRAESNIVSPNWIANKKATINPKNEKDNKCFQWSMIAVLNYNIAKEKELKKLLNFKRIDIDFASHQRYWENFEQENNSIAINVLFVPNNSEESQVIINVKIK